MPFDVDSSAPTTARTNQDPNRAIGRKEIVSEFERRWGITTWMGVKYQIRRVKIPMARTPSNKPVILVSDLNKIDICVQR